MLYVHNSVHFGGCEAYRMTLPADTLRQLRGAVVDYANATKVNEFLQKGHTDLALSYDLYVLPRAGFQNRSMLAKLHEYGKKIAVEVDDDFTGDHRPVLQEPAYSSFWDDAAHCDGILVSTPYLARLMHERTGRPTYICPNSVPVEQWAKVPKAKELTIGLTGSFTHEKDWRVLETVLPQLLADYPFVHLLVGGYLPPYLSNLPGVFPEQVRVVPWMSFADYPAVAGSVHITLCPVDPADRFNWSKSGIKAIEGLAAGAAVVATDMSIYREVLVGDRDGLLVEHTPAAWHAALVRLITDSAFRQQLASRGSKRARKTHNIMTNSHLWWDAFTRIMAT